VQWHRSAAKLQSVLPGVNKLLSCGMLEKKKNFTHFGGGKKIITTKWERQGRYKATKGTGQKPAKGGRVAQFSKAPVSGGGERSRTCETRGRILGGST